MRFVLSQADGWHYWRLKIKWVKVNRGPALYIGPWTLVWYRR